MNSTDRVLSNISYLRTMLENFPNNLLDGDWTTYNSAFDFIMDVLRCCGIDDKYIISYLIGKLYGFEIKPGYKIDGLYDGIKNGLMDIDMQNKFINGLEISIKSVLMALFSSIYTCSAIPILPNKVFDYNNINGLMSPSIEGMTRENESNDELYKLKIPVSTIDIIGMLSINPTTPEGSLYYSVDGKNRYYEKKLEKRTYKTQETQHLMPGDKYICEQEKYTDEYKLSFKYQEVVNGFYRWDFCLYNSNNIETQSPIDLEISVLFSQYGDEPICTETLRLVSGETRTTENLLLNPSLNDKKSCIHSILINGYKQGIEIGNSEEFQWLYLTNEQIGSDDGIYNWERLGGSKIDNSIFGETQINETEIVEKIVTEEGNYTVTIETEKEVLTYRESETSGHAMNSIRYTYVPDDYNITEESPQYIVCYEGVNPNILYRTYDMNAFIWNAFNRGSKSNQIEKNHLMWDNRVYASKEYGITRANSGQWNEWYESKAQEGMEFIYEGNEESNLIHPIIQIEPYRNKSHILVRIPSQQYFLPKKRQDLLNNVSTEGKFYFNASIYKFDWDYLKSIQILNPKLMLIRLIEHLIGLSFNIGLSGDIVRKEIELRLSTAVKSIIEANDLQVEDCWKSFSNEEFDDLLNQLELARYQASEYNGESVKARTHDLDSYLERINEINANASSEGTTTMITKLVNDIMVDPGEDAATEWDFEWKYNGKFDSGLLNDLLMAIVMPIIESIFTPQVMLLMMINLNLLGVVNIDEAFGNDFTKIINLLINKVLGLTKSIVLLVKDKIIELLLDLFLTRIKPILTNGMLLIYLEHITDWLIILLNAVKCIPMMNFKRSQIGYIEDVDYADIVNEQNIPESQTEC